MVPLLLLGACSLRQEPPAAPDNTAEMCAGFDQELAGWSRDADPAAKAYRDAVTVAYTGGESLPPAAIEELRQAMSLQRICSRHNLPWLDCNEPFHAYRGRQSYNNFSVSK